MMETVNVYFSLPFVDGKVRARNGRGHTYNPKKNVINYQYIRAAFLAACKKQRVHDPMAPRKTPVHMTIISHRQLPKSARVEIEEDTGKPDIDNIEKLILDALNGYAWVDDAQVTKMTKEKKPRTREKPMTYVDIEWRRPCKKNQ